MTEREKLIEFILKLTDKEAEQILSRLHEEAKPKPKPMPYHRYIYSIKNSVNGKEYIGRTKDYDRRISSHMSDLKAGRHSVDDMQEDFDKYGNVFTASVLEEVTRFEDRKREYELIESHKTYVRENGYNYNDTCFRRWKGETIQGEPNEQGEKLHR